MSELPRKDTIDQELPPTDAQDSFDEIPPADDGAEATNGRAAVGPAQRPPLRRSREDKVVAGVAGGIGRYLGIDPVIIRIAFVVLAVSGGSGLLLYLIGVIAIPEEREGEIHPDAPPGDQHTGVMILGGVLIVAGGLLLADRLVPNMAAWTGPLVLMGLGVAVVIGARR